MKRFVATLALAAVALAAAACGSGNAAEPSQAPASQDPNAPVIAAKDLKFDRTSVDVPAGKAFTLVFDNADGAPHNVAIYGDESAKTTLFSGEIFSGPAERSYSVPSLAAGTYFFRCDVHPDMKGTIVAD